MNEHACRALAAWANPKQEHDLESSSAEYVSQQLIIAAAADSEGPGAVLLNEDGIEAQLQSLAKFRNYAHLLNLPTSPTIKDLKSLIEIIYHMNLFDFPEYYDFEKAGPSDEEAEKLATILLGRFCKYLNICIPKNISQKTIYYHLDRLYCMKQVIQRQGHGFRDQLPVYSQAPPPIRLPLPQVGIPTALPSQKRALFRPDVGAYRQISQQRSIWARAWSCIARLKI